MPLLDDAYLIQEKKVKTEHVCKAHYVSKYFKMSKEVQAILRVEEWASEHIKEKTIERRKERF